MDYRQFIRSNAIRDHLYAIQYPLSSLESAWVVWKNDALTLQEKTDLWLQIADTMPDQEVRDCNDGLLHPSLHDFLRRFAAAQKHLVELFLDPQDAAYSFTCLEKGLPGNGPAEHHSDGIYRDYDSCLEELKRYQKYNGLRGRSRIEKRVFDDELGPATLFLNVDHRILRADGLTLHFDLSEEDYPLTTIFPALTVSLPTPFQRGDILYRITDELPDREHFPFVYFYTETRESEDWGREPGVYKMTVVGCYCRSGYIYPAKYLYFDLDYYTKELRDGNDILGTLSQYLHGAISVFHLLNRYRTYLLFASEPNLTEEIEDDLQDAPIY